MSQLGQRLRSGFPFGLLRVSHCTAKMEGNLTPCPARLWAAKVAPNSMLASFGQFHGNVDTIGFAALTPVQTFASILAITF